MNPYKKLVDTLGRMRAQRRLMLHRQNFYAVDLSSIEWAIGCIESELEFFTNGHPF